MRPERLLDPSIGVLVERADGLTSARGRRLLGITGPPGAGKSTVARGLCDALGAATVLVPMDGFHRSNEHLAAAGLTDRKGAPETFDGAGFVDLLRRLRAGEAVSAPSFDRDREETVPGAIPVPAAASLVVVEGNYLLLDERPWTAVRPLLDACWYLAGDAGRVERLIARHVTHGRSAAAALEWVLRNDEANARRIATSAARADLVIEGLVRLRNALALER